MYNTKLIALLKFMAISGNILFILWMLFNAMDEGWKATMPEKLSALTLTGLLLVNNIIHLKNKVQMHF